MTVTISAPLEVRTGDDRVCIATTRGSALKSLLDGLARAFEREGRARGAAASAECRDLLGWTHRGEGVLADAVSGNLYTTELLGPDGCFFAEDVRGAGNALGGGAAQPLYRRCAIERRVRASSQPRAAYAFPTVPSGVNTQAKLGGTQPRCTRRRSAERFARAFATDGTTFPGRREPDYRIDVLERLTNLPNRYP